MSYFLLIRANFSDRWIAIAEEENHDVVVRMESLVAQGVPGYKAGVAVGLVRERPTVHLRAELDAEFVQIERELASVSAANERYVAALRAEAERKVQSK